MFPNYQSIISIFSKEIYSVLWIIISMPPISIQLNDLFLSVDVNKVRAFTSKNEFTMTYEFIFIWEETKSDVFQPYFGFVLFNISCFYLVSNIFFCLPEIFCSFNSIFFYLWPCISVANHSC